MTRSFVKFISVLLLAGLLGNVQAAVTGLPDFTELVEKAGPAVVNIQVTQFGNRA